MNEGDRFLAPWASYFDGEHDEFASSQLNACEVFLHGTLKYNRKKKLVPKQTPGNYQNWKEAKSIDKNTHFAKVEKIPTFGH